MTEDEENLRKFLESDDPAMVRMGLSMAKGIESPKDYHQTLLQTLQRLLESDEPATRRMGLAVVEASDIPEELYKWVMALSLWDSEKENREAAKELVEEIGIKNIIDKEKAFPVRRLRLDTANWNKPVDSSATDKEILVRELSRENAVVPLIMALGGLRKFLESHEPAMRRMGLSVEASDIPEELYKNVFGLSLWDPEVENWEAARELVEEIGLENITEFPGWLEPFEEEDIVEVNPDACYCAVDALGEIGGVPGSQYYTHHFATGTELQRLYAVELLIDALGDGSSSGSCHAAEALGKIGDTDAVEPLIELLVRDRRGRGLNPLPVGGDLAELFQAAAEALGEIGDTWAVEPLIEALGDDNEDICWAAAEALVKITESNIKGKEKKNLIKFLESEDIAMVRMGAIGMLCEVLGDEDEDVRRYTAYALGEIGDVRAVEPLIKALEDDGEDVRKAAKIALSKLGHEVE